MKLKLSILWTLVMYWAVMALERLPRPEDMTYGEKVIDLLRALFLLAFLTPVGWAVIVAVIIGLISWARKSTVALVTTDYTRIPEEDKRDRLLKELENS